MTGPEAAEHDLAAEQLAEQLGECHAAVMSAFKFAASHRDPDVQLNAMLAASRMMRASASAAAALKRLRSDGNRHNTRTVIHQGDPASKKMKTNGHDEAAA